MIVSEKTALTKVSKGTATVTGRVKGEHGIEFISLDDHELSAVLHVENLENDEDCKQLEAVVTQLDEPTWDEVESWLEDNTWV